MSLGFFDTPHNVTILFLFSSVSSVLSWTQFWCQQFFISHFSWFSACLSLLMSRLLSQLSIHQTVFCSNFCTQVYTSTKFFVTVSVYSLINSTLLQWISCYELKTLFSEWIYNFHSSTLGQKYFASKMYGRYWSTTSWSVWFNGSSIFRFLLRDFWYYRFFFVFFI